ncbi:hypothetical protein [Acholeplasma laidlawii]|uniref:Uncharacterized protein n=1 Tax=Acholeplasma laidlawii TaxID=2148 RepID=A0A553IH67_ACHLA|nr:hypothetical protein [Acholeplasma laidlawii]NWH09784.1 hypothetical protein [Acholeplasma laidlawii]NWH11174.1 hypothetical protein [Acholeplasma laidlawii]NWH13415.1 hypothetical protein [Acholeplasma laidlawii]NWH14036.1 hypothetical protein [Acholeplasma laidlawii]PII01847.1 hypothetical protein B9P95_004135 [Acholeplasma laidlawii]
MIYEYNLSGSVQQILVPDLIHGKIYRFEIYVEYEMNFFITNNYRVYQREFTYLKSSGGGGGGGPKPPIQELMY